MGFNAAKTGELPSVGSRFFFTIELTRNGAIVRLLLGGARRFHDLSRGIPEISDKMLSERLKELEADFVRRQARIAASRIFGGGHQARACKNARPGQPRRFRHGRRRRLVMVTA